MLTYKKVITSNYYVKKALIFNWEKNEEISANIHIFRQLLLVNNLLDNGKNRTFIIDTIGSL